MDSILASHPAAPGSNPDISKISSDKKIVNVAKVNQRHCCLEQWTAVERLNYVDRIHIGQWQAGTTEKLFKNSVKEEKLSPWKSNSGENGRDSNW